MNRETWTILKENSNVHGVKLVENVFYFEYFPLINSKTHTGH